MRAYLGLDNGGTVTKAALYDSVGRELGAAVTPTETFIPKPGYAERDMEEMWQANCRVIRTLLEKTGVRAGDIAGVGICGHGKGLYLWGKDGCPVRAGIGSTDNRAYQYPLRWRSDGTEERAFAISCQKVMSCQPVALLAWLRDNEPESFRNIRWIFECKDYVRFRMTGVSRAEITDYSGANLVDLHTGEYDRRLLELFGLEELYGALPPLCRSTEICGTVTAEAARQCGLMEGTPVIGGMFDIDACALATGVTDERRLCVIAGTWSINEYVRRKPVTDGSVSMNSIFCLPGYYLVEESSPTSAGNNEWFVKQLLPEVTAAERAAGRDFYSILNSWVESIPPEEFVPVFLPYIMASNVHPNAGACFVGMNLRHSRRHLLRSVYEGIVFCHKTHIDRLLLSREEPFESVRLAGGAARSRVWTGIFADTLGLPVETVNANETGTLGCAIAAAAAVGEYRDVAEAASKMIRLAPPALPNPETAEIYKRKYALYNRVVESLDGVWDEMQSLIEG